MVTALKSFFLVSLLTHGTLSQGPVQVSFSRNPVYSGEIVTLTFTYMSQLQLVQITVDAFNETLKKGFLFYRVQPPNSTGMGVFVGKSFNGWPNIPAGATNFSVTLTAMPSLELDYNCSIVVADLSANRFSTLTSTPARLMVYDAPFPPRIVPSPITFNNSDSGFIICESPNGNPAAAVSLTVIRTSGGPPATGSGIHSARVILSSSGLPLQDWHNAVATCVVTNHKSFNLSVTSDHVRINYIVNISIPAVIYRNESVVLNCSAYIRYYPAVQYSWTIPVAAYVTGSLYLEWLFVPPGQIGSFYCTATNNVTMTSVVIVFTLSNWSRPSTPAFQSTPSCGQCWIIGPVLGTSVIVVITVVLGVLCKRRSSPKGRKSTQGSEMHQPGVCAAERSNAAKLHSIDQEYDSLNTQRSFEPTYSHLAVEKNSDHTTLYENVNSTKS